MSISNDNVVIQVLPEKVKVELNNDIQSISVLAENIIVQTTDVVASLSATFVVGEIPVGAINGSNATFTTINAFVPESVIVILNSTIQTNGVDFVTNGVNTIILNVSPVVGDILRVNYKQG